MVPKKGLEHKYLYYYLGSIIDHLNDLGTGATFKELSGGKLKEVKIPVPPLQEQGRIVGILDHAFDGIATAKANAEKNLQNARAIFESHLDAVFSQRGEGWVEKPLCSLSKIINGFAFKSEDFVPTGGEKCIKITNVGVREFVSESGGMLPHCYGDQYSEYQVRKGNIVIALTRTIISAGLKVAIVPEDYDGALLNQRVAAISPNNERLIGAYLFAYLSTGIVYKYVQAHVNTLMQPNLSINDLRSLPIPTPSIHEQKRATELINNIRNETSRLEAIYQKKITALDDLKKSLLDQAFTGNL